MTTELEKQFFDTFGIESKMGCTAYEELVEAIADLICNDYCPECDYFKEVYPQITDRHYLELILIYSETDRLPICYDTVEHFKEGILECFIEDGEDCKHQVQAIFEGER